MVTDETIRHVHDLDQIDLVSVRGRAWIFPSQLATATRRRSTAWAETTSPEPTATPPTPSSPPPATTSAVCSNGWLSCCRSSWPPSPPRPIRNRLSPPPDPVLHSRLVNMLAFNRAYFLESGLFNELRAKSI